MNGFFLTTEGLFRDTHIRIDTSHYLHMFVEDICQSITPSSYFLEDFSEVYYVKCYENEGLLLSFLNEFSDKRSTDLVELIDDFIRKITASVLWNFGTCFFEIARSDSREDSMKLQQFNERRSTSLFGYRIQFIPLRVCSETTCCKFSIPESLGGPKKFRKMLRTISKLERYYPSFFQNDVPDLELSSRLNFDLIKYNRNIERILNSLMIDWGWNRRDASIDNQTEYQVVERDLQFKIAMATLRNHMLNCLCSLLNKLDLQCELSLKDRYKPSYYKDLYNGSLSFAEVSAKAGH